MKKIIAIIGFLGVVASGTSLVSAGYFETSPVFRCDVSITRTLQVGSYGDEVYTLQEFLARAGYLQANPNGNFGPATRSAVRSFQYDNGISATGSVGEATRNALNERLCDADISFNSYNDYYGYASGVTRVDDYDPFAIVMVPKPAHPVIYETPGNQGINPNAIFSSYTAQFADITPVAPVVTPVISTPPVPSVPFVSATIPASNQIQSVNIIYNPFVGYTYGITPRPGTLTVSTPAPNSYFREGDTVHVSWSTNNIDASGYQVVLENTSGGQTRVVAFSNGSSASFVLTRDILETVCSGNCISYGKNSYRIVIATPLTDIAGNTSLFKASVSPITIDRPAYGFGTVSITTSQTPVDSGQGFRLYVNIPTGASWDTNLYGQYSFTIRAICPVGISVSIAGVPCGQDFSFPVTPTSLQQQIPAMITNSGWLSKEVTFDLVVKNVLGQVIGTSQTTVKVNGLPFTW